MANFVMAITEVGDGALTETHYFSTSVSGTPLGEICQDMFRRARDKAYPDVTSNNVRQKLLNRYYARWRVYRSVGTGSDVTIMMNE